MNRDGAQISLWQNNIADFQNKTTYNPAQTFDVVVVGGGITGIVTALLLQKSGKKCLVAEAHTLCFGTTGGTTAHLNTFFDTTYTTIQKDFGMDGADLAARAAKQALELVKENVETYNIDCEYAEKSGYVYSQDKKQTKELEGMLDSALDAGVSVGYSSSIPVPIEFEKAIVFPNQAQFHPTTSVLALAKAFDEAGGVILQHCR